MAFSGVSAPTATIFTSSVTTLNINLSTAAVGDLYVIAIGLRYPAVFTTPAGWTEVGSVNSGGVGELTVFTRPVDGTEGAKVVFTNSVGNIGAAQCRTIFGSDVAVPIEMATSTSGGLPGTTANPPALTPSWGAADTTWIALNTTAASGAITTASSPGYTGFVFSNFAGGGASAGIGSAYKDANATSEDPGSVTSTADRWWMAATLAIKPGEGGGSGPDPIPAYDANQFFPFF